MALSRKRRSTQVKLDELNAQSARYQAEIDELDQLLHIDSTALMKLLTLRERVKPARVIELLISSDGPLEQKRREVYLAALFRSGARKLRALSLAKQRLGARRRAAQLLERRAQDLKRVLDEQSAQLAAERRAEWEVISSHRARTSRAGSVDAQEISHWERSNQLPPTQGRWIDEFRSFRGLSLAKLYGSGVWILNQSGAPVYSVAPGRVIFSGEVKGWGGVVIAQHDLDYLSIYANLSQVIVKTGARVRAQQRLGDSGDEAGREGLYFELRRGGQPIHPERLIDRELLRAPLRSPPSP